MRYFLTLVFFAVLAPALFGQSVHGKVTMKSGRVLIGRLVEIHEDRVQLRVPEGLLSIDRSKIAAMEEIDPRVSREVPAASPLGETVAAEQAGGESAVEDLVAEDSVVQAVDDDFEPVESASASDLSQAGVEVRAQQDSATSASSPPVLSGPDVEVSRLIDRYLWFVPQEPGHRLTLGAAIFLCLTLIVHLSSRMANLEGLTFGKSLGVSALLFVVLAIELTFAPVHPAVIAGICFVDVVLWFLCIQLVYQSGMYRAVVMLVSFLLASMVGVLSLEVMGFVVQRTMLT